MSAYPNPSNGPVYLVYHVPEGVEQAMLRLFDSSGRLLLEQRVGDRTGIVEFIPNRVSTGMHIASLVYDGIPVAHAKINLVR
jgi:hypothetical protein